MEDLDHIVWIKEGSWRVLSCYATEREAREAVAKMKRDGDKVKYAKRGDRTDLSLRANVWQ